jgi:hypothetical protein
MEKRKAEPKSTETTGLRSGRSRDKAKGEVVGDSRKNGAELRKSGRRNSKRQTIKSSLSSKGRALVGNGFTKTTNRLFPFKDEYWPKFPHVTINAEFVPNRKVTESTWSNVLEAFMSAGLGLNLTSP